MTREEAHCGQITGPSIRTSLRGAWKNTDRPTPRLGLGAFIVFRRVDTCSRPWSYEMATRRRASSRFAAAR